LELWILKSRIHSFLPNKVVILEEMNISGVLKKEKIINL